MPGIDDILRMLDEDPAFRDRLAQDPRRALAGYDLSADDLARLEARVDLRPDPKPRRGAEGTTQKHAARSLLARLAGRSGPSGSERGAIPVATAALAAGLLVTGAGAGYAVERAILSEDSSASPVGGTTHRPSTQVYECPGAGTAGTLRHGDRVFATAVHADLNGWLRVRDPLNPARNLWIEARFVLPDESTGDLPEAECDEVAVTYGSAEETTTTIAPTTSTTKPKTTTTTKPKTTAPTTTTTTLGSGGGSATTTTTSGSSGGGATTTTSGSSGGGATTTTSGSSGGGATTTTTAGDATGPSIGQGSASPSLIEENGTNTPCDPINSTVSAQVSDSSGIQSVTVAWSVGNQSGSKAMSSGGGATYSATVGNFPDNTIAIGSADTPVTLTITARDNAGNTSSSTLGSTTLKLRDCTFG